MSRDLNNVDNDLSWLASSNFLPSVIQLSNMPRMYEAPTLSNIEPWESLTNVNHVRRNLNKNWIPKSSSPREYESAFDNSHPKFGSSSLPDSLTHLPSKESTKEAFIQNAEKQTKNWNSFDPPLSSIVKDFSGKYAGNSLSGSLNLRESPRNLLLSNDQTSSLNQLFSLNFEHMNAGSTYTSQSSSFFHDEKKIPERLGFPITPISLSPSTTSGTPPKLNADLIALMQELALITNEDENIQMHHKNISMTPFPSPPHTPTPTKGCVFCKNNSYHSTFYKSHSLKDDNGHCTCPVLRTYVCPLCGGTGDYAHTLKYCPRNTVTKGDPIAAGLPPGKVTNWREVATKMAAQYKH